MTSDYLEATYDMFLSSIAGEQAETRRFGEWLDQVEQAGLFAFENRRQGKQGPEVCVQRVDGETLHLVNMSSYNYLGYAHNPEVIAAAHEALDRFGLGAASSPVHGGTFEVHLELEQALLDFVGLPDRGVSLFSSGYGVNTGTISAMLKRGHHVVMDRSAHMSILEGAQLSRAKTHYFAHNDVSELRGILEKLAGGDTRILVCTEGVFSADGDFGRLREIVDVSKEFGALVLVDEAHSFGVAGPTGRGVCEAQGVLEDVDLLVLTFSKAFGGVGGALVARTEVARYVNWYARCRMFSCALDPAVSGGIAKALRLAAGPDGQERRERVWANAAYLRERLEPHVDIGPSESWIVPVVFGDEERTLPLLNTTQHMGLDGSVLQFPAVPFGESRMRLFVTSEHTREQLDRAVQIILLAAREHGFLRSPQ